MKVILEKPNRTKVIDHEDGSYTVEWEGVYNFDGFLDPVTYQEKFEGNYMYSTGCICRHNLPLECRDNRTPKERALSYAESL